MSYLEKFHYQLVGSEDNPKLIFLHGLMGAGKNWARVVSQLSDRFQVLTFDQRGHGRSFKPESGYHPEDYANDLNEIVKELGWSEFHLVGHSMGGRNAIVYAALYPDKVKSLVVEDIGIFNIEENRGNIKRLLDLVPTPFATRKQARDFFQNTFAGLIPENNQAKTLANYFYMNMSEQPDGTTSWRFSYEGILASIEEGRSKNFDQEWKSLTCPTLLIRGQHSTDLPKHHFEKMLALCPLSTGVVIENSGHWVHFDQPEKFIETLSSFLISNK